MLPTGVPGLFLSLAIGFLIGIERGWRDREKPAGTRVAGVRTFSLIGLLGGLIGLGIGSALAPLWLLLGLGAVAALLVGYWAETRGERNMSATSTVAAILTLGLGAAATAGSMSLASVGAGATMILLASRHFLHRAIRFSSEADLQALLRLVLVVLVVLPLLPDQAMGPFAALNPRRLWLVVVVTGAVSFIGYVLARWLGQRRGTLITAFVGALVSSTAVTLDSARRIRESGGQPADHAAVAIASLMMLLRALTLVALLAPFALIFFSRLLGPAGAAGLAAALVLLFRTRGSEAEAAAPRLKPPGLALALLFAGTVAFLAVASAWAQSRYGESGGLLVIALGGIADIDAAIAAVGALPRGTLSPEVAGAALAWPILLNTLFKLGILVVVGGWRRTLPSAFALMTASAALAIPLAAKVVS